MQGWGGLGSSPHLFLRLESSHKDKSYTMLQLGKGESYPIIPFLLRKILQKKMPPDALPFKKVCYL